ncbi:MAG TPA: hypothetical protein VM575_19740 [Nocardioides sp.]|nr:hypothetical protein [Nocardioides sp.]
MDVVFPLVLMALFGLAFLSVLVMVPVLILQANRRAAERRAGLAAYAQAREWEYRAQDRALVDRFSGAPFGRGHDRQAVNVLLGRYDGRPFTAFDYHHVTGSGDERRSHDCSVVALNLGVVAPDLAVGPTTTLRRWVDALTGRDIPIGDRAFDDFFTVHSPSPEFARDVLLSDVRDVMRHHPTFAWRITGDSLLVIRPGGHAPGDVDGTLHVMGALLDRIPEHVWHRLAPEREREQER